MIVSDIPAVYLVSNGQNPFTYRFPILESDVNTSDAIQVEVAEDSHLGVKVAADDLPEDLTSSGYYLVPRCKTASEECSIFAVLSVSSLVIKSKEQSCFGEHSAEPFVCTVDKSNNGDKVEETVNMNLGRTKPFQLKNPCPQHWPPDLLIHCLYLVFWG